MKYCWIAMLALGLSGAQASTLYKCTDDFGHTVYTNFKAGNRKCVMLSRESAPEAAAGKSAPRAATPSPADFPKVSAETQRGRDSDRRTIVQRETENELKNLEEAKKALAQQQTTRTSEDALKPTKDRIALHERNLLELQRELSKLH